MDQMAGRPTRAKGLNAALIYRCPTISAGCQSIWCPVCVQSPRRYPMPSPKQHRKNGLSADRRRALKVLAASPNGCTEALMLAHGFKLELLGDLILDGLATAHNERMRAGKRAIEVTRVRITEAGRQALRHT
jgi:hypothetical protein